MNETVHRHIKMLPIGQPDEPIVTDGSTRPCWRFHRLCDLAGLDLKTDIETGELKRWIIKDPRKTCGTHHERNQSGAAVEILAHSVNAITYKHYADTSAAVMRAILTLEQPPTFYGLAV